MLVLASFSLVANAPLHEPITFDQFTKSFVAGYRALHLPSLQLSYKENLDAIQTADSLKKQEEFFITIQQDLKAFDSALLTEAQKDDYNQISYETNLNLERIILEKRWISGKHDSVTTGGLYGIASGKAWYGYFLKRWVAAEVSPNEIYAFGLKEVQRVKDHIEGVRKKTGLSEKDFYDHLNDDSFFLKDRNAVQQAFEKTKQTVYNNLPTVFNVQNVPVLSITKGISEALVQTPGYYSNNTFYYNYFNKPYNKRQVDWLFIHEAVPGHHYQSSIARAVNQSEVHRLFYYLGFSEGWAAYAEELGKAIGLYQTPYDELGKYEWDIVRSVRVPLDVALNYYGWTDAQALAFWKENIRNQDDIAMREINRMRRWPAQVVTYKYGAAQIMLWRDELMKKQQQKFDIRDFHDKVLNRGSLPFFMIKKHILGEA